MKNCIINNTRICKASIQTGAVCRLLLCNITAKKNIPAVTQDDTDEMSANSKCSSSSTQADDGDDELHTVSGKERINYPTVQEKAIDEFDTSIDIFALAFPWLFPGGHGGPFGSHPTRITL